VETSWKIRIGRLLNARKRVQLADSLGLFGYGLPKLAASEESIRDAEQRLKVSLPVELRNFLEAANGWPLFWHHMSILGTEELERGSTQRLGTDLWGHIDPELLQDLGINPDSLLLVGLSAESIDRFVISVESGHVLWIAGDLIEDFESFSDCVEFFISIQDQDLDEVRKASN
jgi:hypothetical protein